MVRLEQVTKTYAARGGTVTALDRVNLEVKAGEFVLVRGPSGCGKTTLLLTLGGMLRPTSGTVTVAGQDVYALSPRERARFRATHVGFIFQMFHLVPYLTVTENVLLAPAGGPRAARVARARDLLARLGLEARGDHTLEGLSAGERQRTAIARALFAQPRLILADEPTGNLDPDNAQTVLDHLREFHRSGGTVVLVTHGPAADGSAERCLSMQAGHIPAGATGGGVS